MTQEERLMILQMVADKKITVAEGVELLKAVSPEPDAEASGESRGTGVNAGAESGAASGGPGPGPGAQSRTYTESPPFPGTGFAAFVDDVIDRVSAAVGDVLGARYEFPEQLMGEFAETEIPIHIATGNGRVNIQGWDRPGFQADIVVKARGSNAEDARLRARDAYTVRADASGFELEARRFELGDVTVHVNLLLPRHLAYRLETRTGNGQIEVSDLSLRDGQITTGNGRVVCRGGQADLLRLQSGNGAVEVEMDVAELEAGTGNGSLVIRPNGDRPQTLRLSTGNGSMRVDTSRLPAGAEYRVDADAAMGGVDLSLSGLVYQQESRGTVHKHVVAQSQNFGQGGTPVVIQARTGMGSIAVF